MPWEKKTLFDAYTISEVSVEAFDTFYQARSAEIYPHVLQINSDIWLSARETSARQALSHNLKDRITTHFLIYHHHDPVGWHCGYQIDAETFYMFESGILPAHQGRGIYTALLPLLLDHYESLGFQKVTSQHHASNNAVLVPKLKAGFMITGFSIDESVGVMVQLTYAFHPQRRRVYEFRTGYRRPDDQIRRFL